MIPVPEPASQVAARSIAEQVAKMPPSCFVGNRVSLRLKSGFIRLGTLEQVTDDEFVIKNRALTVLHIPRKAVQQFTPLLMENA